MPKIGKILIWLLKYEFSLQIIYFKCVIFFHINTLLFLRKSAKFTINCHNINFSWRCYFLNAWFFCINLLFSVENHQNSRVTVEIWIFFKADNFKREIFFAQIRYYFTKNRQNSWLIFKIWTFLKADIFLNAWISCVNMLLYCKRSAKFAIFLS